MSTIVLAGIIFFIVGILVGGVIVMTSLANRDDLAKRLVTAVIVFTGGVFVFSGNNGIAYSLITGIVCGAVGAFVTLSVD